MSDCSSARFVTCDMAFSLSDILNFPVRKREKRAFLLDITLIRVGRSDLFKPAAQQGGALFVAVVQQGEGVLRAQHAREILHLAHEAALRLCEHRIDRAAAVFAEELQIHLVAQQKRAVEPDSERREKDG